MLHKPFGELARKYNVKMEVLSAYIFRPSEGTKSEGVASV